MTQIKIEKDIPLPKTRSKYPWAEMDVGDSFFVPGIRAEVVTGSIFKPAKEWGWKFAGRTLKDPDGTLQGCGCGGYSRAAALRRAYRFGLAPGGPVRRHDGG